MFDVTRLSTFEAVQMWKADLDNKVLLPNGKPIPAVLLANKVCVLCVCVCVCVCVYEWVNERERERNLPSTVYFPLYSVI